MKSKRILLIALMALLVIISNINFVYADSVSVTVSPTSPEYAAGQTVVLTVSLTNIESDTGIFGLSGELDYSTDIFEEIKVDEYGNTDQITALNGWGDLTYNSETKEFEVVRTSPIKSTQNIMKISLKVKEGAALGRTTIMLSNLEASDSVNDISTTPATATVEIKNASDIGGTTIPVVTTPSVKPTSSPITIGSSSTTPSNKPSKLPQTGISDNPAPILFGAFVVGLISFVAYRRYKDI